MSSIERLHRTRAFPTMRVESDPSGAEHWMYMHADIQNGTRPCFRTALMDDMWSFLSSITLRESQRKPGALRHVVIASDANAFNLGGDLELFSQLIRDNNREQLLAYARRCVDGVYHLHASLGGDVRTIALVQGDALGGGMELALACQTIVAEEGVSMGLPEVLFGLFPGMGAHVILSRKLGSAMADRLITSNRTYSAQEMYDLGLVHVLAENGDGVEACRDFIRKSERRHPGLLNARRATRLVNPIELGELKRVVDLWADAALQLSDGDLKVMNRLTRAQERIGNAA